MQKLLFIYLCPCVQSLYGLFQDCQLSQLSHPPWVVPAAGLGVMTKGEVEGEGRKMEQLARGKDATKMERGGERG